MALALALVVLMVVSVLVAGVLVTATEEARVGESARSVERALANAEAGAFEIIRGWDARAFHSGSSYPVDSVEVSTSGGFVYRLDRGLYFVDVTGRDSTRLRGGATQRVGLLTRIRPPRIDLRAALTIGRGPVAIGTAVIDGNDRVPGGWTGCGAPDSARAGIRAGRAAVVSAGGSSRILGNPPIQIDASVGDATFSELGDVTYSDLALRADITLPGQTFSQRIAPVAANGRCNTSVTTNWGDGATPAELCGDYFPIVHVTGDASVTGDLRGQGILLVDGSLSIRDRFQWYGIAIVRGTLAVRARGFGAVGFGGAVLARDGVVLGDSLGNARVTLEYSKCAIIKALQAIGGAVMLRSRGWIQLF